MLYIIQLTSQLMCNNFYACVGVHKIPVQMKENTFYKNKISISTQNYSFFKFNNAYGDDII